MNNFTKEELEHIIEALLMLKKGGWIKSNESIQYKIQSIIENYCDHKEQYEDLDYHPMRCQQCLEIVE